ncbi:hypothetical protein AAG570_005486 [Ranatra chinensis]|uniref:Dynein heavy chain n=1 Tax=Ranatra chinensis TaxID=642074 RepID=A0ABD0XXK2_9HEMI
MGLPGGSRQEIYPRFLRHFCLYSINSFSEESTTKIFSSILFNGLRKNGFSADVIPLVQTIVSATMVLYLSAIDNLLPTPAKSHYVFNIRDFARVINGHLLMRKEAAEVPKKTFVRLWVHETLRVFYDRLIDSADKEWFYKEVRNTVKENFRENFDTMLDNLGSEKEVSEEDLRNLLFTTALDLDADEERKYEEIPSIESFYNVAMMQLDEYNAIHKTKMNIVLFRYALEHLSRICRVLSMPSGSALLVGVGGSGRQSLTRLAATMCAQTVFQPEISKSYGFNEWRDDLKRVLKESGGRNKNTVFLFTEGQIKADYFLQDIDSLLNSGEVPNIFPIDEVQEVLEMVRLAAQGGNRNLDISPLVVFSYFIKRCKRNLHILLCFSPIGSSFRIRLRLYPSLVNCCTVDWFEVRTVELTIHMRHWCKHHIWWKVPGSLQTQYPS